MIGNKKNAAPMLHQNKKAFQWYLLKGLVLLSGG
jgi:hypothetical protein